MLKLTIIDIKVGKIKFKKLTQFEFVLKELELLSIHDSYFVYKGENPKENQNKIKIHRTT